MIGACAHVPDMTRAVDHMLLSRLHLHAVLPALENIADLVPQARALVSQSNFALGLRVAEGPAAMIHASGGTLRVEPAVSERGGTVFHFLRPSHLNAVFQQRLSLPPLPVRGLLQLLRLRPFLGLTKILDATLQPPESALADDEFRRRHLLVSFQVALRAVPIVAREDPLAIRALATTPVGLLEIRIPDLDFVAWIEWRNEILRSEIGRPAVAADAVVTVRDEETARLLVVGQLDPQVALGLGRVRVDGLIPLADGLDVLLHRVDAYLGNAARARS
jgi:hypothetical protein